MTDPSGCEKPTCGTRDPNVAPAKVLHRDPGGFSSLLNTALPLSSGAAH
jgi:hypothetical protein